MFYKLHIMTALPGPDIILSIIYATCIMGPQYYMGVHWLPTQSLEQMCIVPVVGEREEGRT